MQVQEVISVADSSVWSNLLCYLMRHERTMLFDMVFIVLKYVRCKYKIYIEIDRNHQKVRMLLLKPTARQ